MVLVSLLTVVVVLVIGASIILAIRASARRAGLPGERVKELTGRFGIGVAAWLVVPAVAAGLGITSQFDARPPRLMVIVLASFGLLALVTRTRTFKELVAAAPRTWPIAIQTMRVPIELGLWGLFVLGRIPEHLTFEGRNFDVFVGLTAPVVAWGLHRGWIGSRGAILWNLASLVSLVNIVGMAVTSVPGPLHLDWPGIPNTVVATFPFVWLPSFLVPVALFGHVLSLRQLTGHRSSESRSSSPSTTRRAAS